MLLKEYIDLNKPRLEQELHTYLKKKQLLHKDDFLKTLSLNKIIETVTGGKLLRGILVLLAYQSKKKVISSEALKLAAAVELYHTGLIIHDDIMDNDHLRRGKPTIYSQLIEEAQNLKTPDPIGYGKAVAICIGDIAFFIANELLGEIEKSSKIVLIISKELQKVGYAQIADIYYGAISTEPTEAEILSIYQTKTARYSFSLPLIIGGMLAKMDSANLEKFEKYGEELGTVFQIKDDALGIFGDTKVLGKPIGSDIRENKKTLFRNLLFQQASKTDTRKLKEIFGKKNLSQKDIQLVKDYADKYKINSYLEKLCKNKSDLAKKLINTSDLKEVHKQIFNDLVDFINNRDK